MKKCSAENYTLKHSPKISNRTFKLTNKGLVTLKGSLSKQKWSIKGSVLQRESFNLNLMTHMKPWEPTCTRLSDIKI